jgi:hypothetical protein
MRAMLPTGWQVHCFASEATNPHLAVLTTAANLSESHPLGTNSDIEKEGNPAKCQQLAWKENTWHQQAQSTHARRGTVTGGMKRSGAAAVSFTNHTSLPEITTSAPSPAADFAR